MTNKKMREEFEKWEITQGLNVYRSVFTNEYLYSAQNLAWAAWKASRENIEIELPKYQFCPDSEYDMGFKGCRRACKLKLAEQGFKMK